MCPEVGVHAFDTAATTRTAVQCVMEAVALAGGDVRNLGMGPQRPADGGHRFREAMQDTCPEYEPARKDTPERNRHAGPFHVMLQREYIWSYGFALFRAIRVSWQVYLRPAGAGYTWRRTL